LILVIPSYKKANQIPLPRPKTVSSCPNQEKGDKKLIYKTP